MEEKLSPLFSLKEVLSEEEAAKMGRKDPEEEVEKFVSANTQELGKDKWLCPLSGKKFKVQLSHVSCGLILSTVTQRVKKRCSEKTYINTVVCRSQPGWIPVVGTLHTRPSPTMPELHLCHLIISSCFFFQTARVG